MNSSANRKGCVGQRANCILPHWFEKSEGRALGVEDGGDASRRRHVEQGHQDASAERGGLLGGRVHVFTSDISEPMSGRPGLGHFTMPANIEPNGGGRRSSGNTNKIRRAIIPKSDQANGTNWGLPVSGLEEAAESSLPAADESMPALVIWVLLRTPRPHRDAGDVGQIILRNASLILSGSFFVFLLFRNIGANPRNKQQIMRFIIGCSVQRAARIDVSL